MSVAAVAARLRAATLVGGLVAGAVALAVVLALAAELADGGGTPELDAAVRVARAAGAAVLLFALCGLAPARLLSPTALRPWTPLVALPLGACLSGLALTVLGRAGLALELSIGLLLAAGAAGALLTARGREPTEPRGLIAPAVVAAVVACLIVVPLVRDGSLPTVVGGNGDTHLATGAAELLQEAPPGAERPELPIDHMPVVWESRYPIIYVLAATSSLSGLDPVAAFTVLCAVLTACVAIGFFLLAVTMLGSGTPAALLVMALAALGRGTLGLTFVPFYNLLWGFLTLPLVLVAGWLHLRRPEPRTLVLLLALTAIAVLAYPLFSPFFALFLAVVATSEWRAARARGERPDWLALSSLPRRQPVLALALAVVVVALPLAGSALEKIADGVAALAPGGDLGAWHTPGDSFARWRDKFGMPEGAPLAVALVLALAGVALWRAPRAAGRPLAALAGGLLAAVLLLRLRDGAQLFHLRTLSFLGPLALALAGAGTAWLVAGATERPLPSPRSWARRAAAVLGLATVAAAGYASLQEIRHVEPFVGRDVWEVREWGERVPAEASVRVDVRPVGLQQWAGYMLSPHPLTASNPLTKFFPYPPVGRRADLLLVNRGKRPRDAAGAAIYANESFALYEMRRDVPGPEVASRQLVDPFRTAGVAGD